MIRRFFIAMVIGAAPAGMALADNDIGCGVGTILWEGQRGVFAKTLAATTNGVLANQLLGISSGTLGCQQGGVITAAARLPMYASANLDQIAADMAAGEGEALDNLAALYGIVEADRAEFQQTARANFAVIFADQQTTAGGMLTALEKVMAANKRLAVYVS